MGDANYIQMGLRDLLLTMRVEVAYSGIVMDYGRESAFQMHGDVIEEFSWRWILRWFTNCTYMLVGRKKTSRESAFQMHGDVRHCWGGLYPP